MKGSVHLSNHRFAIAGLLTLSILIAVSSISAVAAPRSVHQVRAYRVADQSNARASARIVHDGGDASPLDNAVAVRAIDVSFDVVKGVTEPVWDAALWISRQALAMLADSGLDPGVGDSGVLRSVSADRAASALAFGLIGLLLFGTAGSLYFSWKMWRVRHIRTYR